MNGTWTVCTEQSTGREQVIFIWICQDDQRWLYKRLKQEAYWGLSPEIGHSMRQGPLLRLDGTLDPQDAARSAIMPAIASRDWTTTGTELWICRTLLDALHLILLYFYLLLSFTFFHPSLTILLFQIEY